MECLPSVFEKTTDKIPATARIIISAVSLSLCIYPCINITFSKPSSKLPPFSATPFASSQIENSTVGFGLSFLFFFLNQPATLEFCRRFLQGHYLQQSRMMRKPAEHSCCLKQSAVTVAAAPILCLIRGCNRSRGCPRLHRQCESINDQRHRGTFLTTKNHRSLPHYTQGLDKRCNKAIPTTDCNDISASSFSNKLCQG